MEPMLLMVIGTISIALIASITAIVCKIIERKCQHEYETIDEYSLMPHGEIDKLKNTIPYGKIMVLRCKKCGRITSKKLLP